MINNCIFELIWASYEDSTSYLFIGPEEYTEESFQKLCNSLIINSCALSLAKYNNEFYKQFIGWEELLQNMIPLLEAKNFIYIKSKKAVFRGSHIIDINQPDISKILGTAKANIHYYNQSVKEFIKEYDE